MEHRVLSRRSFAFRSPRIKFPADSLTRRFKVYFSRLRFARPVENESRERGARNLVLSSRTTRIIRLFARTLAENFTLS